MDERCVPSLIVINSTINHLESKVSLITTHCLRVLVVVYKVETLQHQRQWWVTHMSSLIVIGTAINQLETKVSLKTICCLRLFVVVYKHVMLQHQRK